MRLVVLPESELRDLVADAVREALATARPKAEVELLTVAELAEVLRVSEDSIRRWARTGCPHLQAGERRGLRFRKAHVFAWLEERGRA